MSDFRNQEIKFNNAGMNWNVLPEDIPEFQWRLLKNVDVTQEGVLECRSHREHWSSSSYDNFYRYLVNSAGGNWYKYYPAGFPTIGEVQWFGYVGQTKDDKPAYLSIHRVDNSRWPQHSIAAGAGNIFQVFLNGIPLKEARWRGPQSGGFSNTSIYPPLFTSSQVPSVVRIQSPNGPLVVIIDGRWKVIPSYLNLSTGVYYGPQGNVPVETCEGNYMYALGTSATETPTVLTTTGSYYGTVTPWIPANFVGMQVDPCSSYITAAITCTDNTSGALTGDYQWRLTFKNARLGSRSPATPAVPTTPLALSSSGATITYYQPLEPLCDVVELWRKGGDIGDSWRLVSTDTNAELGDIRQFTYPGSYNYAQTDTFLDTYPDTTVALNERLDDTFVAPFPTIDMSGNSINLLSYQDLTTYPDVEQTGTIPLTCFGPFLGQYAFWIGDPQKPSSFFWNKGGKVDLSSPDLSYNTVSDPGEVLMNGFVFGGQAYIFSRLKLYALDYGGPNASPEFVPREIPIGTGLAARNGLAQNIFGVFFVGRRGVFITDGAGGTRNISEAIAPLFRGDSIYFTTPDLTTEILYPAIDWDYANDIRLCATDKNLHLFYRTDSFQTQGNNSYTYQQPSHHLVFDLVGERWLGYDDNSTYCAQVENKSEYVVVYNKVGSPFLTYESDDVKTSGDGEGDITCEARTGSWNGGIPLTDKCFGTVMIDYDPAGAQIILTPYYNSDTEQGTPITVNSDGAATGRRVATFSLGDRYAKSISLHLKWTETTSKHPKFYRMVLLFHPDEEWVKHWHVPASALGQGGYFHLKDSYWCLKSNAAVTLTVNVDGTNYTYSIASTSGVKKKVYQEFTPVKGKLFSFTLDSTSDFVFYGEESNLLGKPWKTSTGYQPLSPFGAAGYAQYLRTQGGT